MAALESLRLLKSYRGYGVGAVIHATPQLAEALRSSGVAVSENQTTFLPADGSERAVEARANVEKR